MLLVKGKEVKVTYATLEIQKCKKSDEYFGTVKILFDLNNKGGYILFDIDKMNSDDFNYYCNKKYKCLPRYDENTINNLEVYSTINFYNDDDFENIMFVEFGNIDNDEIECKVEINEEYLPIVFEGVLQLKKS